MSPAVSGLLSGSGLVQAEARLLLARLLGVDRSYLAAHPEATLDADRTRRVQECYARRRAGEPIAYILGEREFYGLMFRVTPQVLIPRPETELLVDLTLARIAECERPRILELGTGSGVIAVSLALARPDARIVATESSEAALSVARENAARHGARLDFVKSEWFSSLNEDRFDLIVSNPPYVAENDPHLAQGDVRFEPREALVSGEDGLACIRSIAQGARSRLVRGGWLLFEHGYDQGTACGQLLAGLEFVEISEVSDLAGIPRVSMGRFDPCDLQG